MPDPLIALAYRDGYNAGRSNSGYWPHSMCLRRAVVHRERRLVRRDELLGPVDAECRGPERLGELGEVGVPELDREEAAFYAAQENR